MGKWLEVGCSLGLWPLNLIKPRRNIFGVVVSLVHFGHVLFSYYNFIFFYTDDKEETNLINRSRHSSF